MGETLKDRTLGLAAKSAGNFYDLALLIRQLYEADPTAIKEIWEAKYLARRTVYHFLDVGLLIRNGEISRDVAEQVGWTKLQIVARHLEKHSDIDRPKFNELLGIARRTKARDLPHALSGQKPCERRSIVFRLTNEERDILWRALRVFDAVEKGASLKGKEEALMRLAKFALQSN